MGRCLAALVFLTYASGACAADFSLREARIDAPPSPPPYIARACADLRAQVGGEAVDGPVVRIRLLPSELASLGEEGYRLTSSARQVTLTAATWRGANYALLDLVSRLAASAGGATLPVGVSVEERPAYRLRGMYAHTAWVYNHPYALRRWKIEDWKRYVDLLAYQRVNLLQIWNLISILPQPLSQGDRRYLEIFREVVRYARQERGFHAVWLGDAANDIALPSNVPIAERQFYVVHALRNPADPAGMKEITSSRQALYRANPNADGYWIIDSDPGGWPKSPSQDFVEVLKMNRALLDRTVERGPRAGLIYWVLYGWGTGSKSENLNRILDGIDRGLPGGCQFLVHFPEDLKVLAAHQLLPRTLWFRYGSIEPEPSSTYTGLRFTEIRKSFQQIAGETSLGGVMGNAQTPLLQIPNLWLYHHLAWDRRYRDRDQNAVLLDVARQVYPAAAATLARAWRLLGEDDAAGSLRAAEELDALLRAHALGRPGTVGRYLPEEGAWLVGSLVKQLRLHAKALKLAAALDEGDVPAIQTAAADYLDGIRAMIAETGFHPAPDKQGRNLLPFFNWYFPPGDWARIRGTLGGFRKANSTEAGRIYQELKTRYPTSPELVEFLIGNPPERPTEFQYAN
jgi:hypothetical protein